MAALIPNIAKGKVAYYAGLPGASDGLVWLILKASGLESDATLQDYATLATLLAAANDEADFTGYARVVHTASGSVSVDNTNNWALADDTTDPSWSPTTAQSIAKVVCCYDPDTTTGTDADLIPLFIDDYVLTTPVTGTITYQVASGGFYKAA
jgi:hypothetical protein